MIAQSNASRYSSNRMWLFFGLTFLITWTMWFGAAISSEAYTEFPVPLLIAIGGLGPIVSALILLYICEDASEQRDYWQRASDFRRIGATWYLVIVGLVPVLIGSAVLIASLAGLDITGIALEAALQESSLAWLPALSFWLIFGPISLSHPVSLFSSKLWIGGLLVIRSVRD